MRKLLILITFGLIINISVVLAQDTGLETAGQMSGLDKTKIAETGSIPNAAGLVLEQALIYLGIIFFLLIVYSGFLWMTASGNDSKVEKAKGNLIAAVTGLVIIVSAYAITNFIFGQVLTQGVEIKNNCKVGEPYIFANCQPVTTKCEYQGMSGTYAKNLCPGGGDIQCCQVQKQKNN